MKRALVLVLAVLASGCTHFHEAFQRVDSSMLSHTHRAPPRAAWEVEVFLASDTPPPDCERVALVRALATVSVVETLREEAGRLGANAIDLVDFRHGDGGQPLIAEDYWDAVALSCPSADG